MDSYIILYALMALMTAALVLLGISPQFSWRRRMIILLFVGLLPMGYYAMANLLSRPKPVEIMLTWDTPDIDTADILYVAMKEGVAIYLLLGWDGADHPRYFQYPWDDNMAQQIVDAMNEAEQNGTGIEFDNPFDTLVEGSFDDETQVIHPAPTPSQLKPKPKPQVVIQEFNPD